MPISEGRHTDNRRSHGGRRVLVALLSAGLTAAVASTPLVSASAAPTDGQFVAKHSLRAPVTDENFYFVMADRFENGLTSNDTGGISGGPNQHGFDPTNKGSTGVVTWRVCWIASTTSRA